MAIELDEPRSVDEILKTIANLEDSKKHIEKLMIYWKKQLEKKQGKKRG